jgi:hypothetical protein
MENELIYVLERLVYLKGHCLTLFSKGYLSKEGIFLNIEGGTLFLKIIILAGSGGTRLFSL